MLLYKQKDIFLSLARDPLWVWGILRFSILEPIFGCIDAVDQIFQFDYMG